MGRSFTLSFALQHSSARSLAPQRSAVIRSLAHSLRSLAHSWERPHRTNESEVSPTYLADVNASIFDRFEP